MFSRIMDPLGRRSLATCGKVYERAARHNAVAKVTHEDAFVKSGVPDTLEQTGLVPDAGDRPCGFSVTTKTG